MISSESSANFMIKIEDILQREAVITLLFSFSNSIPTINIAKFLTIRSSTSPPLFGPAEVTAPVSTNEIPIIALLPYKISTFHYRKTAKPKVVKKKDL